MKKLSIALVLLFLLTVILPLSEFIFGTTKNPGIAFIIVYELLIDILYALLFVLFNTVFHFLSIKKYMALISLVLFIAFTLYVYIDTREIIYIIPYVIFEIYYLGNRR